MPGSRFVRDTYRTRLLVVIVLMGLAGACFVYFLSQWSERKALLDAEAKAQDVLTYQTDNLISHLNKFSVISALVAKRPDVISMFRIRELGMLVEHGNYLASISAGLSGAQDFWFVDQRGEVFSSNNQQLIGINVKHKPYFEAGFQGRLGRDTAVDDSGQRYYIFASPVFVEGKVKGLVVVRVNLEVVEYVWALLKEPIFATESNGRILLSNIEGWRLQHFQPLIADQLPLDTYEQKKNKQEKYGGRKLTLKQHKADSLQVEIMEKIPMQSKLFTGRQSYLVNLLKPISGKTNTHYMELITDVPLLQWQLHVLIDLTPVKQQRLMTATISSLLVALLMLFVWVLFERRRRLIERARHQRAFSLRLERQVRDRTHELTAANNHLEVEVIERRAAEKALRETQQDLVQAAKLAGIGQMSAALAHEYNQPLAAIHSYADNAQQLLHLNKTDDVYANLGRITAITQRMADLTKTLRSFAHKPEATLEVVQLSAVMDEMIILLSPQAKKQGVELSVLPPKEDVCVTAGHVRLSQVIINLVTNAMDAVKDSQTRHVEVSWSSDGSDAHIYVKDSGAGVPDELADKIFTPFFTTKGAGVGLGLGLFIVYNMVKEFQGTIELKKQDNYGAVFYIVLPLAAS